MGNLSIFKRFDELADQLTPDAKTLIERTDTRALCELGFMEASAEDINEMANFLLSTDESEVVFISHKC